MRPQDVEILAESGEGGETAQIGNVFLECDSPATAAQAMQKLKSRKYDGYQRNIFRNRYPWAWL